MKRILLLIFTILFAAVSVQAAEEGVYIKVIENSTVTFDETVKAVEGSLSAAGWTVMASYESGVDEQCRLRAHNIVFSKAGYESALLKHGPHAAYALPLRAGVYEDEKGTHVAFVNPSSINRTVLGDGVDADLSAATAKEITDAIHAGVGGQKIQRAIGQIRTEGHVGGMGGGKFMKKIEDVHAGGKYADVLDKVLKSVAESKLGWELVYTLRPEGMELAVLGLRKPATEARAFGIAGDKRSSKSYRCPGLDHAAAFPVEVVVYKDDGKAMGTTLDEMYRMKLYFEDAGNWAFMKNMTMPGKIEDEVVESSTSLIK